MSDTGDNKAGSSSDGGSDFFTVGQPLHPVRGGYIRRQADDALYQAIVAGRYAHVIAPARSGKSSLIAATSARLRNNGFKIATLDLSQIAERDGGTDAGRWYYSIAYRLLRQLRIKIDLQDWWQDKAILSNRQRLVEFYIEVVLQNISGSIVVFVDEIQSVESLPFREHLLPSIRAAHNARATDPDLERLSFVLCGECDPESLVSDAALSPFSVSQAVELSDLTRPELDIFATELNLSAIDARLALDRVWHWTGGQPYLSQKLCRALSRDTSGDSIEGRVDRIVMQQLAGRAALHNEPHINHIHRRIVRDRQDYEAMLNLYGRMQKGMNVIYDPSVRPQRKLLAYGLCVVDDDGLLAVRNRLYAAVFTARWANRNLPLHWRGPAAVAALVVLLVAIPFWYTQLLPKPYMRALVSPTLPLEAVAESWRNLRSFPGHSDTADRLYLNLLENRAVVAADPDTIEAIAARARELPGPEDTAERLVADYWERAAYRHARDEQRDAALLAAIESLRAATPERRRLAASLVGEDYPHLVATVPPQPAERVLFNARELLLTHASGARVTQWSLQNGRLQPRDPWVISSLEVTPLLRRVVVDREGAVSRIGLTVNVSHARLDDVRVKLIAPSGRTVDLAFDAPRSSANDETVFAPADLRALMGEPLSGTWSLSLRDEAPGVGGHLVGWNLNLNSQGIVESFDRGLDIPAPLERESDNIWFSRDGRYAVARAMQSDSARLWDLGSAVPARTIAVPAAEKVIGLSTNASFLVTVSQSAVHLWRIATGRRESELVTNVAGAAVSLSPDGSHLLVERRGEAETLFEWWAVDSGKRGGQLRVAGSPALVAMDATGQRLAVADYDRAVRVWDLASGTQLAQLDLHAQASELLMAADGKALAVMHGDQGLSLWHTGQPAEPLLVERGDDSWHARFSPSGTRLFAGSPRRGYRVYRSSDGAVVSPYLDAGVAAGSDTQLGFAGNEDILLTAAVGDRARFWQLSAEAAHAVMEPSSGASPGHRVWRSAGDSPAAIAPGGEHLAVADNDGHVHILNVNASDAELDRARDELNYLGHQEAVRHVVFSNDGEMVVSAAADGSVRAWETGSGMPRPWSASLPAGNVLQLEIAPDNSRIAVLSAQQLALIDAAGGNVLAEINLGELHRGLAIASDGTVFVGSERGVLKRLVEERAGNWSLRNVWSGSRPVRRIAASAERPLMALVDAGNTAMLLDLDDGRVGATTLDLPEAVNDVLFAPADSRVLLRTSRWVHRAAITSNGLIWLDAVRAPNAIDGSRMVVDRLPATAAGDGVLEPLGDRVLLLSRDAGLAEVAELDFTFGSGPLLFGSYAELSSQWRRRLEQPAGQGAAP